MLTADRLYTAAIVVGTTLIPHLVLGIVGDWPIQAFNLHLVLVLLLVGFGWRSDIQIAAVATVHEDRRFEQIARYLEEDDR
ncbi:hypothetical protein L3Q65_45840 [Amycolatopsis sp. FU40]|uniref:hypothetical protein n=1 Tax=Amycolatopsis sp. FU40 TaxID=2914159 RepID=UPI001F2AB05B|nr:hypothetical protein [Amycolatopsis sp. FU40]UKD55097.1 hypothetical protein L3Q65_45840 [Amycolatopsis sp. FU40]